jgi:hypothetical protein
VDMGIRKALITIRKHYTNYLLQKTYITNEQPQLHTPSATPHDYLRVLPDRSLLLSLGLKV